MRTHVEQKQFSVQILSLIAASALLAIGCSGTPPASNDTAPHAEVDTAAVAQADPGSTLPETWKQGPFIEIFVRAFQDSNGDGIGDFPGLTQKLDYLKDLGVQGIWLMPMNPSEDGDHGYAVTDYRKVAREFGTMADFDEFLKQAHARGIGVVMDYVINHSAAKNPLFLQSASAKTNPFRNWYMWRDEIPSGWSIFGRNPWIGHPSGAYLGQFDRSMPDFNLTHPDALRYHFDTMRFWLNRGVDGFRFDAVGHLVENGPNAFTDQPENYRIMGEVRALVSQYKNRWMVCEAVRDPVGYGAPSVCGSAFAFGLNGNIISAAKGSTDALQKVITYLQTARPAMATLLANHDEFAGRRLWDQFDGDEVPYRLAVTTLLTVPGVPFIYYGEEVGMSAGAGLRGDPSLRSPMSWTGDALTAGFTTGQPFRALASNVRTQNLALQINDPRSLRSFYKTLLTLRRANPALAEGSFVNAVVEGDVLRFERAHGTQRALIAINYGKQASKTMWKSLPISTTLNVAYPEVADPLVSSTSGEAVMEVPAQSARIVLFTP
jgi:alpha-amylase